MTTATISIMNTDLAAIPVKEGHTRFYIGSWAWTETNPYLTKNPDECKPYPFREGITNLSS